MSNYKTIEKFVFKTPKSGALKC